MPVKLNLGCGNDIRKGWINLDIIKKPGIDIVHDLNVYPYPFSDNYADYILMKHVLEHLDDVVKTIEEIHRILKPNGKVEIIVPYYKHKNAFTDVTHKHFFTEDSLNFLTNDTNPVTKCKFEIVDFKIQNNKFPFNILNKYLDICIEIKELKWILKPYK